MIMEHWMLLASVVMGLVHLTATSFTYKAQVGNRYSVGPRDDDIKAQGMAGRMQRAQRNFLETFPLFVALVYLIDTTQTAGPLSYWGSMVYVVFRILYLPLYAIGIPWLRTICWQIATTGLVLVGVQLLL